jgi:hypothetical protein
MPRAYIRKYQKELDDLLYFLFEYPELRHLLTSAESRKVEKRRQQLINWLWRQMGRKDDPPLLDANLPPFGEEIRPPLPPPKGTQEARLMILGLYEEWKAGETGRNPGEKAKALLMKEFGFKTKEAVDKYLQRARRTRAAVDQKNADHKIEPFDIPFKVDGHFRRKILLTCPWRSCEIFG